MMPAEQYTYISSRLIKEVFALGGRVHGLVPDMVEERLREKVARSATRSALTSMAKLARTQDRLRDLPARRR